MKNDTVTKVLGAALIMFVVAVLVIAISLPFGEEVKTKSMNADIIATLINPISAIIGALLRGMVSDK
jgi:sugar phosphate permease